MTLDASEPQPVEGLADELIAAQSRLTRSLKGARIRKGLTVEDMVYRTSLPPETIERFEHGDRSLPMTVITLYAHAVDTQVTYELTDMAPSRG
jgi:transcriptional regulator with XRE-family HTH domain